jgi:hypothetical protein
MSESMDRRPNPISHPGIRMLSRIFVIWGTLLLLLSIGLLLISLLVWLIGSETGGPGGVVAIVMAFFLSMPGGVGGLLGILTIVSGQYLRRMQPWTLRLAVFTTVLRSLAIGALTVGLCRSSWSWGYLLLFLIPEIVVMIYLRKVRIDF